MTYRHALHDPAVYEEPDKFRPERWFTTDTEKLRRMNRNFIPFGRGTRMCLAFQSVLYPRNEDGREELMDSTS